MSEQMSPPLPRGTWPAANPPMGWRKMQCKMQKTQHNAARSQWGVYAKPLVLQTQKYFANGTVVASIYGMKNETFTLENRKMEMQILYISDCCGAYLDDAQIQYGICNDCGEHCEVLTEEYPATPVCGG